MSGRRPSIAYVTPGFPPRLGGVETHVAELAARAADAGWDVEVISQDGQRHPSVERRNAITVRRFPNRLPSATFPFAPSLYGYVTRHASRFDVVHAHNYHALPALAAARSGHPRLVFTPHYLGVRETVSGRLLHRLYHRAGRSVFTGAASVICVTATEADWVRRVFGLPAERITVIPNGIDVDGIRNAAPLPADRKLVLTAGRLEPYKNTDRAVRALAHLDDSYTLAVAGTGPARAELEALAERLGVGGRVRFLGHLDHPTLNRWYRTADVYVSMSTRECFGITVVEALAGGAGVVAADTELNREVLGASAPGQSTLVPAGSDDVVLASAVRSMCPPPARFRAEPPLSWDEVGDATLGLYDSVLEQTRAKARP